jgi:cell division protein FtsZ
MNENPCETVDIAAAETPQHDFRVVAVGRAGIHALGQFAGEGALCGVDLIAVHTDTAALLGSGVRFRVPLGASGPRGLGAGGDPSLGEAAAEAALGALKSMVAGARVVFVLTGLGAGTGTGASPVVARVAREAGALVLGVATLPFDCEGRLRTGHARAGMQALKAASDAVIMVPNQRVLETLDSRATAPEVFAAANRLMVDGIRGLWQMLTRPGLIKLDFANLERLLRGRHTGSVFAAAEARGNHRAREVVERLLENPFLERDSVLASAEAVLITAAAGPDIPFAEIEQALAAVQRHCEQAQVVVGTSVDPALAGRLMLTLVAAVGGSAPLPEASAPATAPDVSVGDRLSGSGGGISDLGLGQSVGRSAGGLVPPPPELTAGQREQVAQRSGRSAAKRRKAVQSTFNFDVVSKGRFEKTEATILHGEDLDVPTFLRRRIALN